MGLHGIYSPHRLLQKKRDYTLHDEPGGLLHKPARQQHTGIGEPACWSHWRVRSLPVVRPRRPPQAGCPAACRPAWRPPTCVCGSRPSATGLMRYFHTTARAQSRVSIGGSAVPSTSMATSERVTGINWRAEHRVEQPRTARMQTHPWPNPASRPGRPACQYQCLCRCAAGPVRAL